MLYRSSYPFFRNRSDPIRSGTGAYTSPSGMDPIYQTRYRSLYIIIQHGTDPIRLDTEACTSFPGVDPARSDPMPKLEPILPEWIRPDPIRYRSSYILFRNGSDPVRSDTGAYTSFSGMDPTLSEPIPELIHYFRCGNDHIRSNIRVCALASAMDPTLSGPIPSLYIIFRHGSDPVRSDARVYDCSFRDGSDPIRSYPIRCRSLYPS
jgi:hypothetical protein